jgi:hypothetical protein
LTAIELKSHFLTETAPGIPRNDVQFRLPCRSATRRDTNLMNNTKVSGHRTLQFAIHARSTRTGDLRGDLPVGTDRNNTLLIIPGR